MGHKESCRSVTEDNSIAHHLDTKREEQELHLRHITTDEILLQGIAKFVLANQSNKAFEWLNRSILLEMEGEAKRQTPNTLPLKDTLNNIRQKYTRYYTSLGREMPQEIWRLTAQQLCKSLGVELLPLHPSRRHIARLFRGNWVLMRKDS